MKNKLTLTLCAFYITLFAFASCDDGSKEAISIGDYTISKVSVADLGNKGDASDISIYFSKPAAENISEYYALAKRITSSAIVDDELVKTLPEDRIARIANAKTTYAEELPAAMKDIDGEALSSGLEYEFYVITVGLFGEEKVLVLSEPSNVILFEQKPETRTFVSNFRGNGSIAIDSEGNLYVNEFGAGSGNAGLGTSAFKVTPEGVVEEFVNNLSGPVGNAIDVNGNYYLNNGNEGISGDLMKIASDGSQSIVAELNGYPTDILIGIDGNLYIANWTLPVINIVTPDGDISDFVSDQRLAGCTGITYDDDQNILVGNFSTGMIMSIDGNGKITEIATIPTVFEGFVIGYIDYFDGYVYATGYGSNIIYKVSLNGEIEEFAGNGEREFFDGEFDQASFVTPNGIAIDKKRKILYVSQNNLGNPTSLRAIPLD